RYRPRREPDLASKERLKAFTKLVNQASEEEFRQQIGAFLDLDRFLRFVAVNSLLTNLDSFVGLGHNYFLYLDPTDNRFVFLPWDHNHVMGGLQMFGSTDD